MDSDYERDFADQGPLADMDLEEDAQILATLLKHIPFCLNAADMEQLLQDIPAQPPVVISASAGGGTGRLLAITGHGCSQRLLTERMHSSGARP